MSIPGRELAPLSTPQVRLRALAALAFVGLLVLAGRLATLQLARWTAFAQAATGNRTSVTYTMAPRGMIRDAHDVVLAENRPVWNVSVSRAKFPKDEAEAEKVTRRVASILQAPLPELRADIQAALETRGSEAAPLTRFGLGVPLKVVAQIEESGPELPGIVVTEAYTRRYPHGQLAAHVLGYARAIRREQYETVKDLDYPGSAPADRLSDVTSVLSDPIYPPDAVYGQDGIEQQYEIDLGLAPPLPILTGRRGRTVYEVDAAGNRVRLIEQRSPAVGATVYLTLDAKVQQAAEEALREAITGKPNRTAAAVVVDVTNGDVIALVSLPAFDPNRMVGRLDPDTYRRMQSDPRHVFEDKAIAGGYPPASTFKLVSAVAALEAGLAQPEKRFYCSGAIHEGTYRFECWKRGGHGSLSFREAIAQSCDVYFYELVRSAGLGPDVIGEYARRFGFGERSGLDLPGEIAGFVPDRDWKRAERGERWWTGDTLNMVIGQGYTTCTPLQVAMATAAVANGGDLLEPHLVRKISWPDHLGLEPTVYQRRVRRHLPLKPDTLKIVMEGMRLAVTSEHGTGHGMAGLPVQVAGKTGSAEHIGGRPTHAWFTCVAPYHEPRYAITVFVSEGGHGSTTAAPAARKILAALFGFSSPQLPQMPPVAAD
ncbi:MAG: penicillin-binding protein 2 [Armatimonadetes bacterium]|nr:penicillin-binding protein 2 [Armatimonadota bacterium]